MTSVDLRPPAADAGIGTVTVPEGFDRGDLLAEFARASLHLFRGPAGSSGSRGVIQDAGTGVGVWCCRDTAQLRSMWVAFFPETSSGTRTTPLLRVSDVLSTHRPDAAIIRMMRGTRQPAPSGAPTLPLKNGYVLLPLGKDVAREVLTLSGDFDAFLNSLGARTRHHLRSSLRAFDRAGCSHLLTQPPSLVLSPEVRGLAMRNMPASLKASDVELHTAYINAQGQPFQSVVTAANGRIISLIRGYVTNGYAALVDQMNASESPKVGQAGPSLLHRGLLIGELLKRKMHGLVVIGGCGGALERYCRAVALQTYVAIAFSPSSWMRCLDYYRGNPQPGRWALSRLFGGSQESTAHALSR